MVIATVLVASVFELHAVNENGQGSTTGSDFNKVGSAGAQFLKIGVGARAAAMGGAYTSVTNDLNSVYWNPSGLANVKSISADFSYCSWFGGFSHSSATISVPIGEMFTSALNVISFGKDGIPVTTIEGDLTGSKYSVQDIAVGFTFSGYLTEQFAFGITGRYIQNSFGSVASSGMSFDVGTMYNTGIQGIKLGFSIHNLGTDQQYSGSDLRTARKLYESLNAAPLDAAYLAYPYNLPITFRAGISSKLIEDDENELLVAGDFVTISDSPEQFNLGAEYVWNGFLALRGGYTIGNDQLGFAGGIGLKYESGAFGGKLDYSINPTTNVGLVNRISVMMNFGD